AQLPLASGARRRLFRSSSFEKGGDPLAAEAHPPRRPGRPCALHGASGAGGAEEQRRQQPQRQRLGSDHLERRPLRFPRAVRPRPRARRPGAPRRPRGSSSGNLYAERVADAWLSELERVLSTSSTTNRLVLVAAAAGRSVPL